MNYLNEGKYNSLFFKFITYLLEKTEKLQLITPEVINHLFEVFNGILSNYRKDFIKWVKELESKSFVKPEQLEFFFEVANKYPVTGDFYDFYWYLFLSHNHLLKQSEGIASTVQESMIEKKYGAVTSDGKQLISYSYTPRENIPPPPGTDEIFYDAKLGKIEDYDPFSLEYFDLIWGLLIQLPEEDSKACIVKLFTLFLPDKVSSSQRNTFWTKLISKAIDEINKNDLAEKTEKNIQIIKNCILILISLIEESEKKGTAGCVSHSASLKSFDMTIQIKNTIKTISGKEKEFPLVVKSNMTI